MLEPMSLVANPKLKPDSSACYLLFQDGLKLPQPTEESKLHNSAWIFEETQDEWLYLEKILANLLLPGEWKDTSNRKIRNTSI